MLHAFTYYALLLTIACLGYMKMEQNRGSNYQSQQSLNKKRNRPNWQQNQHQNRKTPNFNNNLDSSWLYTKGPDVQNNKQGLNRITNQPIIQTVQIDQNNFIKNSHGMMNVGDEKMQKKTPHFKDSDKMFIEDQNISRNQKNQNEKYVSPQKQSKSNQESFQHSPGSAFREHSDDKSKENVGVFEMYQNNHNKNTQTFNVPKFAQKQASSQGIPQKKQEKSFSKIKTKQDFNDQQMHISNILEDDPEDDLDEQNEMYYTAQNTFGNQSKQRSTIQQIYNSKPQQELRLKQVNSEYPPKNQLKDPKKEDINKLSTSSLIRRTSSKIKNIIEEKQQMTTIVEEESLEDSPSPKKFMKKNETVLQQFKTNQAQQIRQSNLLIKKRNSSDINNKQLKTRVRELDNQLKRLSKKQTHDFEEQNQENPNDDIKNSEDAGSNQDIIESEQKQDNIDIIEDKFEIKPKIEKSPRIKPLQIITDMKENPAVTFSEKNLFSLGVKKPEEKPVVTPLFNNPNIETKSSLFSNQTLSSFNNKPQEDNNIGIFSKSANINPLEDKKADVTEQAKQEDKQSSLFGHTLKTQSEKPKEDDKNTPSPLFGNLGQNIQKETKTSALAPEVKEGGLFGNNNISLPSKPTLFGDNNETIKKTEPTGLFGMNSGSVFKGLGQSNTSTAGLFSQENKTPVMGGLFGGEKQQTGGLFNLGGNNDIKKTQSEGLNTGGLFSNTNKQIESPPKGGLFGTAMFNSNQNSDNKPGENKGGLFGNLAPK